MIASAGFQTAVGSTRLTVPRAAAALEAFVRDTAAFFGDHPLVLMAVLGVATVFFGLTRPRVH